MQQTARVTQQIAWTAQQTARVIQQTQGWQQKTTVFLGLHAITELTMRTANIKRKLFRVIKQTIRMTKQAFREGFQQYVKSDRTISRSDRSQWPPPNEGERE